MRNFLLIPLAFISTLACCSEGIKGPPLKPPTIPESYLAMAIHYNNQSVYGILAFYSPFYRHDGMIAEDLDSLWTHRLFDGLVTIKGVEAFPVYNDTLASCVLDVYYVFNGVPDTIRIEPGMEYDDVCFWKKEGDFWKLYGNQLNDSQSKP